MAPNYKRIGWPSEKGILSQVVCYKEENDTDLLWGATCVGYRCTRSILLDEEILCTRQAVNELGELGWDYYKRGNEWYCSSCTATKEARDETN